MPVYYVQQNSKLTPPLPAALPPIPCLMLPLQMLTRQAPGQRCCPVGPRSRERMKLAQGLELVTGDAGASTPRATRTARARTAISTAAAAAAAAACTHPAAEGWCVNGECAAGVSTHCRHHLRGYELDCRVEHVNAAARVHQTRQLG